VTLERVAAAPPQRVVGQDVCHRKRRRFWGELPLVVHRVYHKGFMTLIVTVAVSQLIRLARLADFDRPAYANRLACPRLRLQSPWPDSARCSRCLMKPGVNMTFASRRRRTRERGRLPERLLLPLCRSQKVAAVRHCVYLQKDGGPANRYRLPYRSCSGGPVSRRSYRPAE